MATTMELPETIYKQSVEAARKRGISVEQFIVRALERQIPEIGEPLRNSQRMKLPPIHSKEPGTMDLSNFDFDDLLACDDDLLVAAGKMRLPEAEPDFDQFWKIKTGSVDASRSTEALLADRDEGR